MNVRWLAIAPVPLAVACGLWAMNVAGVARKVLALQGAWLVVGGLLAWAVARTPRARLERAAVPLAAASVLALGVTAAFGERLSTASRWLAIGPVTIQTSPIVFPLLVWGVASCLAHRRPAWAFVLAGAAQAALIAQPDGAMAVVLAVTITATTLAANVGTARTLAVGAMLGAGAAWALVRDPELPIVRHVEDAFDVVAAAGTPWIIATVLMLGLLPVHPLASAVRASRISKADVATRALCAGIGVLLLTSVVIPVVGPYPVPLVGYGGASVVGFLLGLALVLAIDGDRADLAR